MPFMRQKVIYRTDLLANPGIFYVFGDNEERVGYGGQAGEMRDEPNALGVATCSLKSDWVQTDYPRQIGIINLDFKKIEKRLRQGRVVVFPADGIGTGIAGLAKKSPKAFAYIEEWVANLTRMYSVIK